MDLRTSVAASMLPASRTVVSFAFNQLRHDHGSGAPFLELLWAACGRGRSLEGDSIEERLLRADEVIERGRAGGIHPTASFEAGYPPLLSCTRDPPPVLWARGSLTVLETAAVAIVGSRAASPYALQVGERIAAELAERGIVVCSGLARGVDSAAHRGCLEAGGQTVAVLGSGVDRVYPSEHADLADRIAARGLLLAELAPGAAPLPEHFPLRNRIISGISRATVIVEASERSGSLITARYALEQGREVMAVPGSVLSGRNRGSHALLKDGARVVETADDILQELGLSSAAVAAAPGPPFSQPLLRHMELGESYDLEALVASTSEDAARLLPQLTELELAGVITAGGGRFVRLL